MSDLTARMLAKADAERRFRDLEAAAAQSQRDVRHGRRDLFGTPTKKGLQEVATSKRPAPVKAHDRTDEIIAAHKTGATIKRIALELRISQVTVSRTLTEAGLREPLTRSSATDAEVVAMYVSGMSLKTINAATRMHPARISAAVKAAGVALRSNGSKRGTSCQRAGHDWSDPKNVRSRPDGSRICAECSRQDARARHARKAAA